METYVAVAFRGVTLPDWNIRCNRTKEHFWLKSRQCHIWLKSRVATLDAIQRSTSGDQFQSLCEDGHVDKAIEVMFHMHHKGTAPSVSMYRSLLKACTKRKSLAQVKQVHAHLARVGLEHTAFLGDSVINSLVKCGGLQDALQLFHRLPQRTVVSWTAIISGHTTEGHAQEALRLYQRMRQEGLEANKYTYVSLLKACGSISDLEAGKGIHDDAVKYGWDSDLVVATCLVDMFSKCGSILNARNVFNGLCHRDVVSWNAMLAAYAQQTQAEKALELYGQMLEEGVYPNNRTLVSVLQACCLLAEQEQEVVVDGQCIKVRSLQLGKAIHAEAERTSYDVFVGSALVSMYGKCGTLVDAQNVFDGLSQRNVVSWNAMLAACVQQGRSEKVAHLYEQMWENNGVSPNNRTFISVLQACGMDAEKEQPDLLDGLFIKVHPLKIGKAVHAGAQEKGYESDVLLSNTLVSMYGKCGSIADAQNVFGGLSEPSVVSWNVMLAAYAQKGQPAKAFELYVDMRKGSLVPDKRTFIVALQACTMIAEQVDDSVVDWPLKKEECLQRGKAIHADAWGHGYILDAFTASSLISLYGKCESIVDAQNVFDESSDRDVVVYNAMLTAYAQQSEGEKALELYSQLREDMSPNDRTFVSALQACGALAEKEEQDEVDGQLTKPKSLEAGKVIHAEAWKKGYKSDPIICATLISMYGKCGSTVDARNVFDGLFDPSVVFYNAMLSAYVEQAQGGKALQLYTQMQEEDITPNDVTLFCILQVCSMTGSLDVCKQIHHNLVSTRNIVSLLLGNTLIHTYGRCASMVDAHYVFDAMPQRNTVSWNSLVAGYARQGNSAASLQCFEAMQVEGIKPNGITFLSLLSACSHAGLVHKGVEYFESMSRDHGITPSIDHYVTMVDLLGRAGYFSTVECLLSRMPVRPNLSLWLCLLGACRKHGKVLLGKQAFDRAVSLNANHGATYLLMSNIYAYAGLLNSAKDMDALRRKALTDKEPGKCWIEHEQGVHIFVVGDPKQRPQEHLYSLLEKLGTKEPGSWH